MMNMMTGAVAINGGVGVMEIRQPKMAEVVEQVSTVAADVAQNAHITLRELKEKIDAVVEQKLPTFKTLMEQKPVAVAQTTVNDASLTVYENGYAVYEVDGAHTVMAVERCGDCRYDFTDGTYQIIPAEEFENMEWSIRLLMEGEEFSKLDEDDYIEFQPDLSKITVTLEEMAPHTNARYGRNEIGMGNMFADYGRNTVRIALAAKKLRNVRTINISQLAPDLGNLHQDVICTLKLSSGSVCHNVNASKLL